MAERALRARVRVLCWQMDICICVITAHGAKSTDVILQLSSDLVCLNLGAGLQGGAGVVQFGGITFSVGEMAGSASITLNPNERHFRRDHSQLCNGQRHSRGRHRLHHDNWHDHIAADQASQSFSVPILNNGQAGPNKTVNLMLSNPTGGAMLGSPPMLYLR